MHDETGKRDAHGPTKATRTVIGTLVAVAVAALILAVLWALDWPRQLFVGYLAVKIGLKGGVAAFAGIVALVAWWRERRAGRREAQPAGEDADKAADEGADKDADEAAGEAVTD
ncbi:hypothetical protein [Streptomyces sp. NPDC048623]|uniref:hypothetical protein n=1 Tax=Streptomyces sp. NPDC048623 TaxID=3155761 RepID=UPI0034326B65